MIEIVPCRPEHEALLTDDLKDRPKDRLMLVLDRGELLGYSLTESVDGRETLADYALFLPDPGHRLLDGLIKATLNRLDLAGTREVLVRTDPGAADYFDYFRGEPVPGGLLVRLPEFFDTACHSKGE